MGFTGFYRLIRFLYIIVADKNYTKQASVYIITPKQKMDEQGNVIDKKYNYFVVKEIKANKIDNVDYNEVYEDIEGFKINTEILDGYELKHDCVRTENNVYASLDAAMKRCYNDFVSSCNNVTRSLTSYEADRYLNGKYVVGSTDWETWGECKDEFKRFF